MDTAPLYTTPSSPTAKRIASGRAAPTPLAISASSSSSRTRLSPTTGYSPLDSPPKTAEDTVSASFSPLSSMRSPPYTPTKDGAVSEEQGSWNGGGGATSGSGDGQRTRRFDPGHLAARGAVGARPSFPPSSGSSPKPSTRLHRIPSVLGYNNNTTGSHRRASAPASHHHPEGLVSIAPAAPASGMSTTTTRFLLTVIPPNHLPHDPPHPRTNPQCSGYGPPEHFRRGTLIPLYPTLSSQLAAIAREYGLPSTGGLVLYLLSALDPSSNSSLPGSDGFVGEGGPRIGEEAWSLLWKRLFEDEEEEVLVLAAELSDDDDDDDYYAPPVPPIPLSHLSDMDGQRSADLSGPSSFEAQQRKATAPSDEAEQQQELLLEQNGKSTRRKSFSSDTASGGDGDGSVYSGTGEGTAGSEGAPAKPRQGSSTGTRSAAGQRSSSVTRIGIGRGLPSSLQSPRGSSRFASAPQQRSTSGHSSFSSHPNLHHSSRQSVRSTSSRIPSGYAQSGRTTSMSTFSTNHPFGGASYGASAVVGKVEFDIDWRRGGKGKWYEGWLEGAEASTATAAMTSSNGGGSSQPQSALVSPFLAATDTAPTTVGLGGPPSDVVSIDGSSSTGLDVNSRRPSSAASTRSFNEPQRPPSAASGRKELFLPTREGLRPLELGGGASGSAGLADEGDSTTSQDRSRRIGSMVSSYSMAALAGHGHHDDEDEDDDEEELNLPSATTHSSVELDARSRQLDEFPSPRSHSPFAKLQEDPRSSASSTQALSSGNELLAEDDDEEDHAYTPLADEDGYQVLDEDDSEGRQRRTSLGQDDSTEHSEYGDEARSVSPTMTQSAQDPLADVFPNDETTWRSMANEPVPSTTMTMEEEDQDRMVETTGLGILGARVAGLVATAPRGVLERSVEDETADKQGIAPPANDVAEVLALLKSGQSDDKTDKVNLASPIHLDSTPTAPESTGVFPPPLDLSSQRRRSVQRPRFGSLSSSSNSLNMISIDVRPPSTVHSSPEYIPQRKQRNGMVAVPAVVERSVSPSSSMSSLARLALADSQRDSTIGLMDGLDDLERALDDLSPTITRKPSPAITQAGPTPDVSPAQAQSGASAAQMSSPLAREIPSPVPSDTRTLNGSSSTLSQRSLEHSPDTSTREFPPRQASYTADMPGYGCDASAEEEAPNTPVNYPPPVPVSPEYRSPPPPPPAVEEDEEEEQPVRSARTTSLGSSRQAVDSNTFTNPPHMIALPPSPMPLQSEDAFRNNNDTIISSSMLPTRSSSSQPPTPPRHPLSSGRFISPQPPLPTKDIDEPIPAPLPPSLPPRSPKSPGGGLKGLRSHKKPWGKDSQKSISTTAAATSSSDAQPSEEGSAKSPTIGTFFQKSGFGKFFNKNRTGSDSSSEPPASSPPLNIRPSFEQQVESSIYGHLEPIPAAPDQSPPQAELTSFPKRKASLDAIRSPTIVEPAPELPSRTYDYAPTAPLRTSDLTAPRPAPAIPSGSYDSISIPPTLQPTVSSDSSRSAYTTLSQATTTPTDVSSPSQSPADVPLPHTPLTPTQPSSDYLPYGSPRDDLTSPRSEYTPQTPTLNVYDDPSHDYRQAASAPATPAAWNKHLEAGSRFSRQPARPKHRFSADIDQLLNQMHEIDFADEESLDQSYAGMDSSEGGSERSSSAASRHRTRQASGPAPPLSPVTEGKTAPPSPPTTKEYPKSMDLTALAGLMTSDLSPPISPEHEQIPPIPNLPYRA